MSSAADITGPMAKKTKPRTGPYATIGRRIAAARERRGITRNALGQAIGKSWQAMQGYEEGHRRPNLATLLRLSDELGVSIDYLLSRPYAPEPAAQAPHPVVELFLRSPDGMRVSEDHAAQLRAVFNAPEAPISIDTVRSAWRDMVIADTRPPTLKGRAKSR